MFFFLSKTINYLIMPVSIIALCWLLYFLFRKARFRRIFLYAGIIFFLLFTNDYLANKLLSSWQAESVPMKNLIQSKYNYGVLLTGMTNTLKEPKDKVYFNANADRMLQAIMLFEEGIIDTLMISGGGATALRKDLQEARVLSSYLNTINFPMDRVIIEDKSRNTYESALAIKTRLKANANVLLISSASHIPRASACLAKQGISADVFPTVYYTSDNFISPMMFLPTLSALQKWDVLIKEWVGYLAYATMGYI